MIYISQYFRRLLILLITLGISCASDAESLIPKMYVLPLVEGYQLFYQPYVSPSGNIMSGQLYNPTTKDTINFVWKRGQPEIIKYYFKAPGCSDVVPAVGPISEDGRLLFFRDCIYRLHIFFNGKFQTWLGQHNTKYPMWIAGGIAPTGYTACALAGSDDRQGKPIIIHMNLDNNRFTLNGIHAIGNHLPAGSRDSPCRAFLSDGSAMVYSGGGENWYWGGFANGWRPAFDKDVTELHAVSYNQNFFLVNRKQEGLSKPVVGILTGSDSWTSLEPLPAGWDKQFLMLTSVSHDGKTVVGYVSGRGVIWRKEVGWQFLDDFIQNTLKLDLAGKLTRWAISNADASKITAMVSSKNFQDRGLIVVSID